jgi:hypothetical protein
MIFFGHVTPAGILELDHPELYGDLLKGRSTRQSPSTREIPCQKFTKFVSRCFCRPVKC